MICGLRPRGGDGTAWCLLPRGHKGLHHSDADTFRNTSGRAERVNVALEDDDPEVTTAIQRAEVEAPTPVYSSLASATAYGFDRGYDASHRAVIEIIHRKAKRAAERRHSIAESDYTPAMAMAAFDACTEIIREIETSPNAVKIRCGANGLTTEQIEAVRAHLDQVVDPIVRHVMVGMLIGALAVEQATDSTCGICGVGEPAGVSGMCRGCARSYDRDAHEEGHVLEAMIWAANRARLGARATGTKGGRHGR
jgi:hypothetical protein